MSNYINKMEENEFPSQSQLDLFNNKVSILKEFEVSGLNLVLKNLETYEEYLEARNIVEDVSRCSLHHSKDYVESMLSNPLYYPFLVKLPSTSRGIKKVVGYFEVYLMPHLGRMFDSRLERVVVHETYRKKGIFNYMLMFVIEFCKSTLKCNRIDLTAQNPIAQRVYECFDFEKVSTQLYRKYL